MKAILVLSVRWHFQFVLRILSKRVGPASQRVLDQPLKLVLGQPLNGCLTNLSKLVFDQSLNGCLTNLSTR